MSDRLPAARPSYQHTRASGEERKTLVRGKMAHGVLSLGLVGNVLPVFFGVFGCKEFPCLLVTFIICFFLVPLRHRENMGIFLDFLDFFLGGQGGRGAGKDRKV